MNSFRVFSISPAVAFAAFAALVCLAQAARGFPPVGFVDVFQTALHSSQSNQYCVVGTTYSGNGNGGTQGWRFLSGTSMAAPHVAGAAAYLADSLNLASPAAIETAVRTRTFTTGSNDQGGTAVRFVQIP
jgi:subtilisin family serine protease